MISLTNIGKQLTSFLRRFCPLSVEEMCPITLAILCYRFTAYDETERTEGAKDEWNKLLEDMSQAEIEPKYWLQSVLAGSAKYYRDRREMYDLFDRVVGQISRLPKGAFCLEYVRLISECSKDYCSRERRAELFNYIVFVHGGRQLELIPSDVRMLVGQIVRRAVGKKEGLVLFDPFCGVGALAFSVAVRNDAVISQLIMQDESVLQADMARLNMHVHGVTHFEVRNEDFLREGWSPVERYDVITSMPVWGLRRRVAGAGLEGFPLRYPGFKELPYDYAVIVRALESLKQDGVMVLAMPLGVLNQNGIGEIIRQQIIEHNDLRAVIEMPVNMLNSTSVAFALLVFQHSDRQDEVMMVNAKNLFERGRRLNTMPYSYLGKIVRAFSLWREDEGLSRRVSYGELANNMFSLLPSQYVFDTGIERRMLEEKMQELNELTAEMKRITREHNEYLRQLGLPELEV